MEVLLRFYHNTRYVWLPAEHINGSYYVNSEEHGREKVHQINILSVKDDNRIGYVVCGNCGEMIENTPEAIEKHYEEREALRDCLACGSLAEYGNRRDKESTYMKNEDGTYHVTHTYNIKLQCDYGYWSYDIDSKEAINQCPYYQCRKRGVQPINDIFVSHPEPFVKQLTVDALNKKKYQFLRYSDGYFQYDMKLRGTLKAMVNDFGIVEYFMFENRGWVYRLYYSDKYNKLFYADRTTYKSNIYDIMTEAKEKQILNKIAAMYEEAKADE